VQKVSKSLHHFAKKFKFIMQKLKNQWQIKNMKKVKIKTMQFKSKTTFFWFSNQSPDQDHNLETKCLTDRLDTN